MACRFRLTHGFRPSADSFRLKVMLGCLAARRVPSRYPAIPPPLIISFSGSKLALISAATSASDNNEENDDDKTIYGRVPAFQSNTV